MATAPTGKYYLRSIHEEIALFDPKLRLPRDRLRRIEGARKGTRYERAYADTRDTIRYGIRLFPPLIVDMLFPPPIDII